MSLAARKGGLAATVRLRLVLVLVLVAVGMGLPTPPAAAQGAQVQVETVATGLEVPWALAFAPDGRLFVTERPGRIRVIQSGSLLSEPFAVIGQVAEESESGLMGIALDPSYAQTPYVYVCFSYRNQAGALRNEVARLEEQGGQGTNLTTLLGDIPGAPNHDGCRLKFGPDGKLWITMGDAQNTSLPQNLGSLAGKVLRINKDGSIPADNPFPSSPVYTFGHRNPQGLAFHPITQELFITEHGPNDNDEVNILQAGGNYGWPDARGVSSTPSYKDPIATWTPTVAPSGATFYTGDTLPGQWKNSFLFTTLKAAHIHRLGLGPDHRTVVSEEELFKGQFGRLRDIVQGPDGLLYFTTSNRDGRGLPAANDDRVLRIVPVLPTPTPTPIVAPAIGPLGLAGLALVFLLVLAVVARVAKRAN